jgi:hypothetical protein
VGVPKSALSGLEKFEAPDPAEWCARGYAVVQPDTRGSYNSEGDIFVYGTQVRTRTELIVDVGVTVRLRRKVETDMMRLNGLRNRNGPTAL